MKLIDIGDINISGPLMDMAQRNFDRLETEPYQPGNIYKDETYTWPGDYEGRVILGLVMLARAARRTPKYLDEILESLPQHINNDGYFGKPKEDGVIDEQQLSGNSWFLRAMCEYYEWAGDKRALEIINKIAMNLIIPSEALYRNYPFDPELRKKHGGASGEPIEGISGGWRLSTDTGCAFIMLDGATHALEVLKSEMLRKTVEIMAEKFLSADVENLNFQTHATLSALRGLLRLYRITGDSACLQGAERIFQLYAEKAMTENYANYNWFGKPEWTEPCAIIDSFIAAEELFMHTENACYLETAHKIFFNALRPGQRINGGFGIDCCSGVNDGFLTVKNKDMYEAHWCCTMRGGEGISRAGQYSYFTDSEGALCVAMYSSGGVKFRSGSGVMELRQSTEYPEKGYSLFEITSSTIKNPKLKFFIPSYADKSSVSVLINGVKAQGLKIKNGFLELEPGSCFTGRIELCFSIPLLETSTAENHIKGKKFMHGFVLLGSFNRNVQPGTSLDPKPAGPAEYAAGSGIILRPVYKVSQLTKDEAVNSRIQIIF